MYFKEKQQVRPFLSGLKTLPNVLTITLKSLPAIVLDMQIIPLIPNMDSGITEVVVVPPEEKLLEELLPVLSLF